MNENNRTRRGRTAPGLALILAAAAGLGAGGENAMQLENDHVQIVLAPAEGGGVRRMVQKRAFTHPWADPIGARVAGEGSFFVPVVTLGGHAVDFRRTAVECLETASNRIVVKAEAAAPGGKLTWKRTYGLLPRESGFSVDDEYAWSGAEPVTLSVCEESFLRPEAWRAGVRSWTGCGAKSEGLVSPAQCGESRTVPLDGGRIFWRLIGQFGVGFCYSGDWPAGSLLQHLPARAGQPLQARWESRPRRMKPGETLRLSAYVLVDEGGRQTNDPRALAAGNRVLATLDVRRCAEPGEKTPGAVTLVSAAPFRGTVALTQTAPLQAIAEFPVELEPGKARIFLFDVRPSAAGRLKVDATVRDDRGREQATASAEAIVGEPPAGSVALVQWKEFLDRIPGREYAGTWEQIAVSAQPRASKGTPSDYQRKAWARLETKRPLEARFFLAAAAAQKTEPASFMPELVEPALEPEGCMNVFFNGPDGPLNAFSKERSGYNLSGLLYEKVTPDEGLAFHMYMGYGVNAAGLSIMGASLNCDANTARETNRRAQARMRDGGLVAPQFSRWFMLASCRTTEEAVAYLMDPDMPVPGEANFLIVDRRGQAAHVYGWGTTLHVRYPDKGRPGFFSVGNYPAGMHEGLFDIGKPGWAVNTKMREALLEDLAGGHRDAISLNEAVKLMETHAAGGMCQHLYDNPGSLATCHSVIAVTRTSELLISHGPPCCRKYYRFALVPNKE